MARLYADEHFPLKLAELLREFDHDVLTAQAAGNANLWIPDEEVMLFAIQEQRAVITMNRRHFIRLHDQLSTHCGIVVCTQDSDLVGQAARIDQAIGKASVLIGKLIRIYRP